MPAYRRRSFEEMPVEQDLGDQLAYQRALQAVIWGMPAVSMATLREATLRDLGARYGDVVYMSGLPAPRHELLTASDQAPYVVVMLNLRAGPFVLEVPAATAGVCFQGTAVDAWMVPIADIGPRGDDDGAGGKFLFLPPGYAASPGRDYLPVPSKTYSVHIALRPLAISGLEEAVAYSKTLRSYPLAQAGGAAPARYIDAYHKYWRTLPVYDMSFFELLAHTLSDEPPQEKDTAMFGLLASIGIRRGAPFMPEGRLARALELAVRDGRRQMEHYFETPGLGTAPYRPEGHWLVGKTTPQTCGTFVVDGRLLVDERAGGYSYWTRFWAKKPTDGMFALRTLRDAAGEPLRGERLYRLRVPAHVPARESWSATVYGKETKAFLHNELDRVALSSHDRARMAHNADGSCDLYFGPEAPPGRESNWVPADHDFFVMFRLYGAERPVYDRVFSLPDLEWVR